MCQCSCTDSLVFIRAAEDKGVMANQGAWCSQATSGGCLTSARRRRTGTDGGQSTSLLPGSSPYLHLMYVPVLQLTHGLVCPAG